MIDGERLRVAILIGSTRQGGLRLMSRTGSRVTSKRERSSSPT
jgi:hypothetical protein